MGLYADWIEQHCLGRPRFQRVMTSALGRARALCGWIPFPPFNSFASALGAAPDAAGAGWTPGRVLDEARVARRPAPRRARRIMHFIGSLQPGGAERQLCNCAIAQHQQGFDVTVLLIWPPEKEHNHYGNLLEAAGVRIKVAGSRLAPEFRRKLSRMPAAVEALGAVPREFCPFTLDVFGEVLAQEPDVFHSWLDHPNIWGGVGAFLAGAPLIVMSMRNVNPTHFPYLDTPYFRPMYERFAQLPGVRFINNSDAGACDYAAWLGLERSRITVVRNGVDFSHVTPASEREMAEFRTACGIRDTDRVIAGVFRLSEEKQPLAFLEVARRLLDRIGDLVFVVAGIGPYEGEMRAFIRQHGLGSQVKLLGRRTDVATIFSLATATLLCSRQEGTPNVLLESQWLGCPVVSTRAGGAVDAVDHGRTGFLLPVGDISGLVDSVATLVDDAPLRARFAAEGPRFVRDRFSVDRMVGETNLVYEG